MEKESTRQVAAFAVIEHNYYLPLEEDDEEFWEKHNIEFDTEYEYWGEWALDEFCDKHMTIDSESLCTHMLNTARVDNDRVSFIKIFDIDKEMYSTFGPNILFKYFEDTIKTLNELSLDYDISKLYFISRYYDLLIELLDMINENKPECTYLELDYPIQFYYSGLQLVKKLEETTKYKPDPNYVASNDDLPEVPHGLIKDYDMQDIHKQFNEFFENYVIMTTSTVNSNNIYPVVQMFFRMIIEYYNCVVLNPIFQIK